MQGTCDPFWSSQKDHLPYFSFKKFMISEFTGIFIITKPFYYFCLFFVYVFFIFSKYGMIYMYFKGWRLTDSLLMADMSKVYIMRRGWTLCLDGIGLAISRSQVGQVRSPGHGYRTVDGRPVDGQPPILNWGGLFWLKSDRSESLDSPTWTDQNGRVKRGSGHFNPFHMTIIWPPLNVLMGYKSKTSSSLSMNPYQSVFIDPPIQHVNSRWNTVQAHTFKPWYFSARLIIALICVY